MPGLVSRVAELRQQRGVRQQALAAAVGVSRQALSAIEAGRATPSTEVALRLARALDCRVEELFGLGDDEVVTAELAAGSPVTPRVALASIGGRWVAHPLGLAADAADGLVAAGARARRRVRLLAPVAALRERLVVAGCAPALGVLAARATAERGGPRITWLERSSADALALLARGQIHVAGVHLDDGAGNVAAVGRGVPDRALRLFRLARWSAGLVVAAGNPRRIAGVHDLARAGLRVVRRDPGTGAEALLTRLAGDAGMAMRAIAASTRAPSHLAVAQAVALGAADTGVAIESVARALGLGFVPLADERFDLVVAAELADDPRLVRLLATLGGRPFRRELESLGGHRATETGDLIAEIAGAA
jgi:putative molybdopterin biosynthesis protein